MSSKSVNAENALFAQTMQTPADSAIPDDLPGRWWVAHTKPRTEKALARDLRSLGLICYLPLRARQTRSRRTGRTSKSIIPVFSGYLFFNADSDQRSRALATNRIAQLLQPPDEARFVQELRHIHRVLASGVAYRLHGQIGVGEWARVIEGPLAGAEGVVIGKLSQARLILNLAMLGQSISVSVNREGLERMEPPAIRA